MNPLQWNDIRKFYEDPEISDGLKAGMRVDPYACMDWTKVFTPIEMDAWLSIRGIGIPLYPQFPVLNYFIDFANPHRKLGLEIDGKQWHDAEADLVRDVALAKLGWRIFRVTGSEAYRTLKSIDEYEETEFEDDEVCREAEKWLNETSDGVIRAMNEVYFRGNCDGPEAFPNGYLKTLDTHRLVNFDIWTDVDIALKRKQRRFQEETSV